MFQANQTASENIIGPSHCPYQKQQMTTRPLVVEGVVWAPSCATRAHLPVWLLCLWAANCHLPRGRKSQTQQNETA